MPAWVIDEAIWEKAKQAAKKDKSAKDYWAVVATIYKKMHGRVKHGTKKSEQPVFVQKQVNHSPDKKFKYKYPTSEKKNPGGGARKRALTLFTMTPEQIRAIPAAQLRRKLNQLTPKERQAILAKIKKAGTMGNPLKKSAAILGKTKTGKEVYAHVGEAPNGHYDGWDHEDHLSAAELDAQHADNYEGKQNEAEEMGMKARSQKERDTWAHMAREAHTLHQHHRRQATAHIKAALRKQGYDGVGDNIEGTLDGIKVARQIASTPNPNLDEQDGTEEQGTDKKTAKPTRKSLIAESPLNDLIIKSEVGDDPVLLEHMGKKMSQRETRQDEIKKSLFSYMPGIGGDREKEVPAKNLNVLASALIRQAGRQITSWRIQDKIEDNIPVDMKPGMPSDEVITAMATVILAGLAQEASDDIVLMGMQSKNLAKITGKLTPKAFLAAWLAAGMVTKVANFVKMYFKRNPCKGSCTADMPAAVETADNAPSVGGDADGTGVTLL